MRCLIAVGILVMVMLFAAYMLVITTVDPLPSLVACLRDQQTVPMMEVTVDTPRVKGVMIRRHAFGCSFYYYEATGAGD
jgi:hypothetical protein